MDRERAEVLALQVLEWLVETEQLVSVFIGSTGADAAQLRARPDDPDLLAAVLEFTLMDDDWVCAAARYIGAQPEEIARARAVLPGGDAPDWT